MEIETLKEFCRLNIGDITFAEAHEKTGIILNINVSGATEHGNQRLLNYITSPTVLIWSACCASSAIPGIFDTVELMCKDINGHIVPFDQNSNILNRPVHRRLPYCGYSQSAIERNFQYKLPYCEPSQPVVIK